jgi:hypothetical protein
MAEDKVSLVSNILRDRYNVSVERSMTHISQNIHSSTVGTRTKHNDMIVTLTEKGNKIEYYSTSVSFKHFVVTLARESLGKAFNGAEMKDLIVQLESIAPCNKV